MISTTVLNPIQTAAHVLCHIYPNLGMLAHILLENRKGSQYTCEIYGCQSRYYWNPLTSVQILLEYKDVPDTIAIQGCSRYYWNT